MNGVLIFPMNVSILAGRSGQSLREKSVRIRQGITQIGSGTEMKYLAK